MGITHAIALRAILAEEVKALVETGAGTAVIQIKDILGNVLVEFDLPDPAYASDGMGTITVNTVPITTTADLSGDCVTFDVLNRDGALTYSGSVGVQGSGADLEVTNITTSAGQVAALVAHSYSAPI